MNRQRLASLALILALLGGASLPARAADTYEISVIASQTGQAAFIGTEEIAALRILEGVENRAGGINGRPIHFDVTDDQSNPAVAVQLANGIIAKGQPAFLGSSISASCVAIYAIVKDNGPLQYCFSPALHPTPQSYGFSGGPSTVNMSLAVLRYFRDRGWKKIALISTTDASGQDGENVITANLKTPEMKDMQLVDDEHFAVSDVTVAAQIARIKATNPDAIFTWTTGPPTATVLRGLHDAGVDLPTEVNTANIVASQISQYSSFLPTQVYFPGFRFIVRDLPGPAAVKATQQQFYDAYAAAGAHPEVSASFAWDPARVLIDALRHVGPQPTAAKIKAYIEQLHDFPGINGMMDFRDGDQRGLSVSAVVVLRWDPAKATFVGVSNPGGTPR